MITPPTMNAPYGPVFVVLSSGVTPAQLVGWMYYADDGWHALVDYDHVHADGTTGRALSVMFRPEEVFMTAEEAGAT